jgi:hypothetical protein
MCLVVVLAIIILPVLGWAVAGWTGVAVGFGVAVLLIGAPTAVFLGIEKKKYDREGRNSDF